MNVTCSSAWLVGIGPRSVCAATRCGIILKRVLGNDNVYERHLARRGWKHSTCLGLSESVVLTCRPNVQHALPYTEAVPVVSLLRT